MLDVEHLLIEQIGPRFVQGAHITLIVRIPGKPEAGVMLTTDTRDEVVKEVNLRFDQADMQDAVRG